MSRTEGWRHDVSFLAEEIKRMHYDPFRKVSQAQFDHEVRRLRDDVPRLTDDQVTVRIMRLMSMIGGMGGGVMALGGQLMSAGVSMGQMQPLGRELFAGVCAV